MSKVPLAASLCVPLPTISMRTETRNVISVEKAIPRCAPDSVLPERCEGKSMKYVLRVVVPNTAKYYLARQRNVLCDVGRKQNGVRFFGEPGCLKILPINIY